VPGWHPYSFRDRPIEQDVRYPDAAQLEVVVERLRAMPPLVTSWEIERLRAQLADAEEGRRFVLQGGDCAETFADCRSDVIASKLKILLQMSLVLVHGAQRPIVRIGRFAGQYAKPRSQPTETRAIDGREVTLPNYFGDLVNRAAFTPEARTPDPRLLVEGYQHAAMTLNFVRSLSASGFADVHRAHQWDLSFASGVQLPADVRAEYHRTMQQLLDAIRFMESIGESRIEELTRVEIFTSHEGLSLEYEAAQTRTVPRREGHWCLTTHFPWIGERTRRLDGAHVELFRGVKNPIGVKLGPSVRPEDVLALSEALNPHDERGKLVLITRMGHTKVATALPPLLRAMRDAGRRCLWICDPMHGNGVTTRSGKKTRDFAAILGELEETIDAHAREGTVFGGVHFELTGEDVTECIGGADGLSEDDLGLAYATACDPRLNYKQALEMAFAITRRLRRG
jgi:3-deoxy-7-phosphoheptulonate synthase